MNTGEAYISLADYASGIERPERIANSHSHSFTPLLSTFAGDHWRKGSEGIFTQVWANGDNLQGEAGFKIRVAAHSAIADDVLRAVMPIIVETGCPFKVIANTALLELAGAKWPAEDPAGDFMTVYPTSQALFDDLTENLRQAVQGLKETHVPKTPAEFRGRPVLEPDNPWPGLDFYWPNESACFFGREEEQRELAQRLDRAVVTVVLGQPGVGKSSLLRAGLKPAFDERSLEPVYLRLRCDSEVHPVQQVRDEINRVLAERRIDGAPFGEGQTLRDYFHLQKPGWLDAQRKPVVPVLIFDQFEDLLTVDAADSAALRPLEAFWTQMANLISNRGREGARQLPLPAFDLGAGSGGIKVVISLRQEQLPKLLARRGPLPQIAQNHFVLKPMTGRKAVEAVLGAGKAVLDPANAGTLAEEIVRRVGRETTQTSDKPPATGEAAEALDNLSVDLALLNFFCQRLNDARKKSRRRKPGAGPITAALIQAEAARIFEEFLQPGEKVPDTAAVTEPQSAAQETEPRAIVQALESKVAIPTIEPPIAIQPAGPPAAVQVMEPIPVLQKTEPPVAVQPAEPPPALQAAGAEPPAAVQALESSRAIPAIEPPIAIQPAELPAPAQMVEPIAVLQKTEPPVTIRPAEPPAAAQAELPVTVPASKPPITVQPAQLAAAVQELEPPPLVQVTKPDAMVQVAEPPRAIRPAEPSATLPAVGPEVSIQEVRREPEVSILPELKREPPPKAPFPAESRKRPGRRVRSLVFILTMVAVAVLTALVVMYLEETQRAQTEVELEEYISTLAAARNTFQLAHKKLSRAESDLALKESNLLVLIQQTREQERENQAEQEKNLKMAGEQTNDQLRISQLNGEKARAESRLAQWSSLMNDLTNQIESLARQKEELESRNHALTATNRVLSANTSALTAINYPKVTNLGVSRQVASSAADDKQASAMERLPDALPAARDSEADASARRNVDVLFIHGECLFSDGGIGFHPLEIHQVLHRGAVIQTGKNSWCDIFIRRAGTLVRLAPESQMNIAKLDLATQNGFPVVETLLALPHGRLFTIVRAMVPGSTLEVSDGVGRSVVEVGGLGDYMVTAPRPDYGGDKLTITPLRIVTQQGTALIAPGQEYSAKDGSAFSLTPSTWEMSLIHLDEAEAEADRASAQPVPQKQ